MLTQIRAAVTEQHQLREDIGVVKGDVVGMVDSIARVENQVITINEDVETVKKGIASMNSQLVEITANYQSDLILFIVQILTTDRLFQVYFKGCK